jgi:hypothetical protein
LLRRLPAVGEQPLAQGDGAADGARDDLQHHRLIVIELPRRLDLHLGTTRHAHPQCRQFAQHGDVVRRRVRTGRFNGKPSVWRLGVHRGGSEHRTRRRYK